MREELNGSVDGEIERRLGVLQERIAATLGPFLKGEADSGQMKELFAWVIWQERQNDHQYNVNPFKNIPDLSHLRRYEEQMMAFCPDESWRAGFEEYQQDMQDLHERMSAIRGRVDTYVCILECLQGFVASYENNVVDEELDEIESWQDHPEREAREIRTLMMARRREVGMGPQFFLPADEQRENYRQTKQLLRQFVESPLIIEENLRKYADLVEVGTLNGANGENHFHRNHVLRRRLAEGTLRFSSDELRKQYRVREDEYSQGRLRSAYLQRQDFLKELRGQVS